jgi:hypothetical protein
VGGREGWVLWGACPLEGAGQDGVGCRVGWGGGGGTVGGREGWVLWGACPLEMQGEEGGGGCSWAGALTRGGAGFLVGIGSARHGKGTGEAACCAGPGPAREDAAPDAGAPRLECNHKTAVWRACMRACVRENTLKW